MVIDKKSFKSIQKVMKKKEELREDLIQQSRKVIKSSKVIIYALHRGDLKGAKVEVGKIKKMVKKVPQDSKEGIASVAIQEYVEAMTYYGYVVDKKIPGYKALGVPVEEYLLGLCDLSGELMRRGVNETIKQRFSEALLAKETVEALYGEFLQFDFRNGELRKKSDQIKWNLKKLEGVAYDISIKDRVKGKK